MDIVLTLETLDGSFLKDFWRFIADGGYKLQEKSTGEKRFYRFHQPENDEYPIMLKLFLSIAGPSERLYPRKADVKRSGDKSSE
ncbi:hypothetical protein [Rhizobium sp. L245/93]|uniref:hypothetical protein n=1 Tax=Rhizobium sp. L245/93 TaxID=2819998 RepID=UPI001ADBAD7B|nr:hypothetical protein [Rhizobium sp. L245/93]MBO9170025.1 hypothetical protein [Rhizobium sp. L245/93]